MIKFLLFAQLSELAECDSVDVEFQEGQSVSDYLSVLADCLPKPALDTLDDGAMMVSVNQTLASWEAILSDGDEVGLLPPFSGG